MLSEDDLKRLAVIEAALAEDAALTAQMEQLERAPVAAWLGARDEREYELVKLAMKRGDVRARYRSYVPFLVALVKRLAARDGQPF